MPWEELKHIHGESMEALANSWVDKLMMEEPKLLLISDMGIGAGNF
jgi:hypothetical protein